jgi:hypothetical protein
MIYFGYSLDIYGWKPNPISFGAPNLKTVDEKQPPKPKPLDPKPTDIQTKTDPLPSLHKVHLLDQSQRKFKVSFIYIK